MPWPLPTGPCARRLLLLCSWFAVATPQQATVDGTLKLKTPDPDGMHCDDPAYCHNIVAQGYTVSVYPCTNQSWVETGRPTITVSTDDGERCMYISTTNIPPACDYFWWVEGDGVVDGSNDAVGQFTSGIEPQYTTGSFEAEPDADDENDVRLKLILLDHISGGISGTCNNVYYVTDGSFLGVQKSQPPEKTCDMVAEGQQTTLACASGIMGVASALYGNPSGSCSVGFEPGSCNADAAIVARWVGQQCVGHQSCVLPPDGQTLDGALGDPCYGTVKQLAVEITCWTPALEIAIVGGCAAAVIGIVVIVVVVVCRNNKRRQQQAPEVSTDEEAAQSLVDPLVQQ